MAAAIRLFRMSKPLGHHHYHLQPCNNSFSSSSSNFPSSRSCSNKSPRCFSKADFPVGHHHYEIIRKASREAKANSSSAITTSSDKAKTEERLDFGSLLATFRNALVRKFIITRERPWKLYVQTFIEKVYVYIYVHIYA